MPTAGGLPRRPIWLRYGALITALPSLLGSELAFGMEVTVFDPGLDPGGR